MKTKVEIKLNTEDQLWWLRIATPDQVLMSSPHDNLVDALNKARLLQIHVDNTDELPIPQYAKAG